MSLINARSLADTVGAVEEAHFFARAIAAQDREETATWIAGRQGLPTAYAGTFALFDHERRDGVRLFTGERITSAAARHVVGEESMRALRLLKPKSTAARAALTRASQCINIGPVGPRGPKPDDGRQHSMWEYSGGTFCCGVCSVALWRNMLAGGFDQQEERMALGLRWLRTCRKPEAQWRIFPYWYTVLALVEMDLPAAHEELRYAASRLEPTAKRKASADPYQNRRAELARRALARIG